VAKTRVIIEWNQETGKIDVGGPIQNKVLIYGVLQSAMDAVRQWHVDKAADRVKEAAPADLSLVRPNGGG
jgi:hypothetical protein